MAHPILVAIVLLIFWSFAKDVIKKMVYDRNALIRFLGYTIALVLAIAIVLFVLTQYLGVKF